MTTRRRRRRSIVLLVVAAAVVGVIVWGAATLGRPETVRRFRAVATWSADGSASVHESIDYHFPTKRHGIYRNLPGIRWSQDDVVEVTADHTSIFSVEPDIAAVQAMMAARGIERLTVDADEMTGVRVKIGDPMVLVDGDHHYTLTYPMDDSVLDAAPSAPDVTTDSSGPPATTEIDQEAGATSGPQLEPGRRVAWNGVGASWDVPIEHTDLDLVAPWRWDDVSCDVGSTGAVGGCTATQSVPGRLEISVGRLAPGQGVTVSGTVGPPLATAPAARTLPADLPSAPWWQRPVLLGGLAALTFVVAGLVVARLLRFAGRDWVMAGAASTDSATEMAFDAPLTDGVPSGARRVDDTRLGDWVGTEFAPPRGLEAWQGGVLVAEKLRPEHRVAWLLGVAAGDEAELEETEGGTVFLHRGTRDDGPHAALLEVAFAGRDKVRLGGYDPHFAMLWMSVSSLQKRWVETSPYVDHRAGRRVVWTFALGLAAFLFVPAPGIVAAALALRNGLTSALVALGAALVGGAALAAMTRAWELRVRTPAGTAMWLRVESFRRFLAASETEHVRQAAERGVLREYAAWAVALGEVDHWNAVVEGAGLPPTTPGLSSAQLTGRLTTVCLATSMAPSTSHGSGGGSSFHSSSSSSGVGGGGGGGGGGSW